MKVCVLGLGYIGLPTALMLANAKFCVYGYDINIEVLDSLSRNQIHIKEPLLKDYLTKAIDKGTLTFSTSVKRADAYIICVPTPKNDDYSCDCQYIIEACLSILNVITKDSLIIIESTIAPNTIHNQIIPLFQAHGLKAGVDFYLAYCPERVIPGNIVHEIIYNDRMIGGVTNECCARAYTLYKQFVQGNIYLTDVKTAEMVKLVENTFRDVNIAFSNELAKVCHSLHLNVYDVIKYANKHPRVNILNPGPGVGGHCLAIDPYFIYNTAKDEAQLTKLSRDINSSMPEFVFLSIKKLIQQIEEPRIAILGITYKGNIDDTRESPGIKVIKMIEKEEITYSVYDPYVIYHEETKLDDVIKDADLVVILSEHDQFKEIREDFFISQMKRPIIFDTKHMFEESHFKRVKYYHFGNIFE